MKRLLAALCLLAPLSAYAADARLSYKNLSGGTSYAGLVTPVCGVGSSGEPISCVDGSKSPLAYKSLSGQEKHLGMVVPVCSVDANGVPQICDLSGGAVPDLSGYVTIADAASTYIPLSQRGVANGIATLDANGDVTAPINTTGTANTGALTVTSTTGAVQGSISGSTKKWMLSRRSQDTYTKLNSYNGSKWAPFTFNDDGTLDSTVGVFANLGADAAFSGAVSAPTISATTSATVPDTSLTDSTTSALNTESASSRFLSKSDAANYATVSALNAQATNSTATYAPLKSPALTGTPTAPTPATTDNSTNVATTAFVNNAFQSVEYSVQGDISTSGSSIQIPFGTSGLYAKFAYTGSGSASMTFYSTTGTLSPVDIRRNSIWGGSGVETFTLDNGSVGTDGVVADGTVYTASQDISAYFIRVGGQVYFLTVWASNNGARAFMGVHKMI